MLQGVISSIFHILFFPFSFFSSLWENKYNIFFVLRVTGCSREKENFFLWGKEKPPIRFQTPPLHTVGEGGMNNFTFFFWGFSVNV
jgi:hypothetical protein